MKLSELKTGGIGTVTRVAGEARFVSRVTSIGITEGCPIEVVQNVKKRPILLFERDSLMAIDRKDCDLIDVEERR